MAPDGLNRHLGPRFVSSDQTSPLVQCYSITSTEQAIRSKKHEPPNRISYGGQRVFSVQDLIAYETRGQGGETVTMELIRDGRRVQIYVPRGPLGFMPSYNSVDPNDPSGSNQ